MWGMPPFLARRMVLHALLPGAGMLFLTPLNWLRLPWLGLAVYLPYCVVVGILAIRFNRRLIRRLTAAGYLLCWQCGYDLSATGGAGRCPECGREFQAESLRALWKRHTWIARTGPNPRA
jgi:hypothetical protein